MFLEKERKRSNGQSPIDESKDLGSEDKVTFLALAFEALDRSGGENTGDGKDEEGNDDVEHGGCCLIVDASILLHDHAPVNIKFSE